MILRTSLLLLLGCLSPFAAACGGGTSAGASSGAPGDPVPLPGGGTVPFVSCGDESVATASGTWDVISSGGSRQGSAVIKIDNSSFVFTQGNTSLSFTVSGTSMALTWGDSRNDLVPIAVTHGGASVDTGVLPLAVGGQWTFASNTSGGENCTASLAENSLNATCDKVRTPQFGKLQGSVIGLRQQQKASVFGALGGVWHFTGAGTGTVDATISGNTFTAVVNGDTGPAGRSGWATVKICNGTAAGKTSGGFELAATRR